MNPADSGVIIGLVGGGFLTVMGWFLNRLIRQFDQRFTQLENRLEKVEQAINDRNNIHRANRFRQ